MIRTLASLLLLLVPATAQRYPLSIAPGLDGCASNAYLPTTWQGGPALLVSVSNASHTSWPLTFQTHVVDYGPFRGLYWRIEGLLVQDLRTCISPVPPTLWINPATTDRGFYRAAVAVQRGWNLIHPMFCDLRNWPQQATYPQVEWQVNYCEVTCSSGCGTGLSAPGQLYLLLVPRLP